MELNDLNNLSRSGDLNKLLNTRFGFDLDLSKVDEAIAKNLLNTATNKMVEVQSTQGDYQTNKEYLCSKLVKETIEAWQVENNINLPEAPEKGEMEPNDGEIEPEQNSPRARCCNTSPDKTCSRIHPSSRHDLRVYKNDIGHCDKRGKASYQLFFRVCSM